MMDRGENQGRSQKLRQILSSPSIIIGIVYLALAAWSWRKWSDILIDFGHELYIPWRLVEGDVLYRDIAFTMGPASQYFNALLFRMFGVSASTLIYANLLILAGIILLIYRIFIRVGDRFSTTVICLFFLCIFAFSQYAGVANYNYVCPYRHEMTHGLVLCLVELLCLVRYAETRKAWLLIVVGVCCGLIALMKVEMSLPALGVAAFGTLFLAWKEQPGWRLVSKGIALFLGGAVVPVAGFVALLSRSMPFGEALRGVFINWRFAADPALTRNYPLYTELMGLDAPAANFLNATLYLLGMILVIVVAFGVDLLLRGQKRYRAGTYLLAGTATVALAWRIIPSALNMTAAETAGIWFRIGKPLPLITLLTGIIFFRLTLRYRTSDSEFRNYFLLTLWSVLSLLLLPKMMLNVQLGHYGFVLAMPATLLLIYGCMCLIPEYLRQFPGQGDIFQAIMLGLIVTCMIPRMQRAHEIYAGKRLAVGTGGDLSYHNANPRRAPRRNMIIPQVIDDLRENLPDEATLLVLPYGINLNYLLRKRNPTPYILMAPWEMTAFGGEAKVLQTIADAPPDYMVIITTPMSGHGRNFFGEPGYGQQIVSWIQEHFSLVHPPLKIVDPDRVILFQVALFKFEQS